MIGGLLLLGTMAYDNYNCMSSIMGSKHVLFGMLGLSILILLKFYC